VANGSDSRDRRTVLRLTLAALILYSLATSARVYVRRYYLFLPDYVRWSLTPAPAVQGTKHIFVLFTDHFEPDTNVDRTRHWAARYRLLAARHHDGSGRPPQHTWFYPGEQYQPEVLGVLRDLTGSGLGEVELHLHHGYDTAESLRVKLRTAIEQFQQFGFLKTETGDTRFAFIHGNFDLDNSMGSEMCGVSTELKVLHDLGCFADFSLPSVYNDAQPDVVNAIYAAKDDDRPKSYDRRFPLGLLVDGSADLMIFQGPLVFAPSFNVRRLFLELDDANIHAAIPASPDRVEHWLRGNVHVPERPDWVFIKLWAHGISSAEAEEATLGPSFDRTLTYLEQRYNDGTRYALHYITAREAYNLAMAAARGATGPPEQYLNADIKPYVAGSGCSRQGADAAALPPKHQVGAAAPQAGGSCPGAGVAPGTPPNGPSLATRPKRSGS
jgi:hypothetical protein